jgi:hypothetical protein
MGNEPSFRLTKAPTNPARAKGSEGHGPQAPHQRLDCPEHLGGPNQRRDRKSVLSTGASGARCLTRGEVSPKGDQRRQEVQNVVKPI